MRTWEQHPLKAVLQEPLRNGLSPSARGTITRRVLTVSCVTHGRFDDTKAKDALLDREPDPSQYVRRGDLLICRGNGNPSLVAAGRIVKVQPQFSSVFPDTIIAARLDLNKVDPDFIELIWNSPLIRTRVDASSRTTNGTYKINQGALEAIRIPLPPLPEQRRIAAILDQADAIRRKRREALALVENLASSAFLEIFGDPMRNPKGWPVRKLGEVVANIVAGWSANGESRQRHADEFGVLKISAVTKGWFQPAEHKAVAAEAIGRDLITVRRGDLLFSRANTRELVAAVCLVDETDDHLFLPDKLWRLEPVPERTNVEYLRFLLGAPSMRQTIAKSATGSSGSMLNVSQQKLRCVRVPVPPLALQERFARIVWASLSMRTRATTALFEAETLFHSLAQRAFRGEL